MGKWFWQILYIYEKWSYRAAHLVIFVSETDRQKAIYEFDLRPENTLLTPYGIPYVSHPPRNPGARQMLESRYGISPQETVLLFFATLSYSPNYEAVKYIAEEIVPRLRLRPGFKFRVLVCGKNLPAEISAQIQAIPEITYCGFVEDINSYVDGADLMINPILSGGGVKTKVIDALARSLTVVSSTTGAEGIDPLVCGNKLVITPDREWNAFADAVMQNKDSRNEIPGSFYAWYSWPGIIDRLSDRLDDLR
jgi:glycosyltransferase involved in cell wall biosynthesis